jgi:hypothetical protein
MKTIQQKSFGNMTALNKWVNENIDYNQHVINIQKVDNDIYLLFYWCESE